MKPQSKYNVAYHFQKSFLIFQYESIAWFCYIVRFCVEFSIQLLFEQTKCKLYLCNRTLYGYMFIKLMTHTR